MAVNKRLLQGAAAAPGGITPSEHFGVVLYEGDGSTSHSINGGKFGAGAYFGGSGNITPSGLTSDQLGPNGEMSISWWMNTPINDTTVAFICEGDTDSEYMVHLGGSNTRGMRIAFAAATTNVLDVNNAFTANTWQHFVAIMTPTGNKLYRDGSLVGSNTFSETRTDFSTFYIGSRRNSSLRFEGKLDQLRIFAKELSSSEVSTLYAETVDTVESLDPLSEDTTDTLQVLGDSSCIASYRFENNEDDESGNYDGTGVNVQYAAGRYGQSARFGNSSYVDLGTITRTSSMTLSAWVKTTSSNLPVVYLDNGAVFRLGIDNSGYAMASNLDGTNATSTTTVTNGSWNHIVAVFNDSGFRRIYVNSSLENSQTYTSGTRTYKDGIAIDNNNPASSQIDIDQVRIFNKALSASEVTTLYNENSLVASYRFEGNANDDMRAYDGTATNVTYEYGLNFTPDFVWIKGRTNAIEHVLSDSSRGVNKELSPDSTQAEENRGVQSFDTGGFTLDNTSSAYNSNGVDYVAWCLKANGGTTSSNTDGTITSTVQVNETAGFSIVKYTGNNTANATIGHGLSSTPQFIISKNLDNGSAYWATYHHSIGITRKFYLNDTSIGDTVSGGWLDVSPTLITLKQINANNINENGSDFINYCFTEVDGFSKFGSYEGNGTTEGPMVETGFEPAFIIIKDADGADNWAMVDNKRATTNPRQTWLRANLSNAEFSNTVDSINFYSNGFQVAGGTSVSNFLNESGNTFIYMAFAADPDTEAPTVAKSFSTVAYTGTGATNSIDGLGFEPSFTWIKGRTNTASHQIFDTIRGATKGLNSDANIAEFTNTGMLTSFDSDGFTLGGQSSVNGSGVNYVAWNWKADDNEATIEKVTEDLDAVAVYKFEDNVNDVTSTYNGTATDITYNSSGKFNKSAIFNGTSSKVSVGNWGLTGNPDFSISMWIKGDDWSGDQYVYGQGANAGTFAAMSMFVRNNSTVYHDNRGSANSFTTSLSLSTGTWYHWLHTYSSSNGLHTLYINGASVGTVTESLNIVANNTGGAIGTREIAGSYYFDGEIDQFRVYQQTLTASNAATLYAETAAQNDNLSLGMTYVASIQSIVSANANAGFSIVKYEGNGIAGTKVPHGLSAAPEMIIIKNLNTASDWVVGHTSLGFSANKFLKLNLINSEFTNAAAWASTNPDSTTFTVGDGTILNNNGDNHIAYCFHSVSGYSKIGSYAGNGTSQTVTLGFRPDFVILRKYDDNQDWFIFDSVRGDTQPFDARLKANSSGAETTSGTNIYATDTGLNFSSASFNDSGKNFLYAAFKIN